MASSSWVLVDDADPRIQYSPGWQAFVNGSEVDGTKHGAASAGLTASFSFTGTQVVVVGSLGSVDVHGTPTSLYTLDGAQAESYRYTAPVVAPGLFRLNVTFFASKTLAPGDHTLVITNVNGTSPNVFWLDYVEYLPSAAASTTAAATSSSSSQSPTTASSRSPTTSSPATASNQAGSSTTSRNRTGAVAGGVVGGVAMLLALVALLVYLRRRRKGVLITSDPPVRPFGSWRSADEAPNQLDSPASPLSRKQMMALASTPAPTLPATPTLPPSTTSPTLAGLSPISGAPPHPPPSASDSAQTDRDPSERATASPGGGRSRSEPRVMTQTVDSGLRLAGPGEGEGEGVMLPPPYTRE